MRILFGGSQEVNWAIHIHIKGFIMPLLPHSVKPADAIPTELYQLGLSIQFNETFVQPFVFNFNYMIFNAAMLTFCVLLKVKNN